MTLTSLTRALAAVLIVTLTTQAPAATLFFDFGEAVQQTVSNYNNVTQAQLPIFNATDSTGASTGISLTTTGFNPGSNQNGTQTPTGDAAYFLPQATRDNLFGHTQIFGTTPPFPQGILTLGGLDGSGATTYDFAFYGGRLGVSDNRETRYNAVGANSGDAFLNASNNSSNVATLTGIVPTAAGTIVVNVSPGPNNNNATGFFYLGAMSLTSNVIPEPATFALAVGSLGAIVIVSRRRRA